MPRVNSRALGLAGGLAIAIAVTTASAAVGQEAGPGGSDPAVGATGAAGVEERGPIVGPAPAKIYLRVYNASNGTVELNARVKTFARIKPFVENQVIQIRYSRSGDLVKRKNLKVKQLGGRNVGRVKLKSPKLLKPGGYRAVAVHKATPEQEADSRKSRRFHPVFPDLDPGNRNSKVSLFNRLLADRGYHTSSGSKYGDATERAVMAFRKVNKMDRSYNATPKIFRKLADGKGGFGLKHPGAGRHVEVDVSRQVMVLADNGKAKHIFHVSTGAPSTPSDRGSFRFYRRQPGYNSLGMYYSVYYNRGEAIHGYKSVPPYNASHGCIRNPIPNSKFIYNWVRLGMPIFVYD
jgi:hypothetical protein